MCKAHYLPFVHSLISFIQHTFIKCYSVSGSGVQMWVMYSQGAHSGLGERQTYAQVRHCTCWVLWQRCKQSAVGATEPAAALLDARAVHTSCVHTAGTPQWAGPGHPC